MTLEFEALNSVTFRSYTRPDDIWRDDLVHVEGIHADAFAEVSRLYSKLKSGQDIANVVLLGRPGVGKSHFLGRMRAHVLAHGDFFVLAQLSSARQFWQSLVVQYLSSFSRLNPQGQTQLAAWSTAFFKAAEVSHEQWQRASRGETSAAEIVSLRPHLRAYLKKILRDAVEAQTASDVAIALMLQSCEDFQAQDVGTSFLQGVSMEDADFGQYGFRTPSLPARDVITAFDRLIAAAGRVAIVCVDQLDGLIAATSANAPEDNNDVRLLNHIADGLMDLSEQSSNSLVVLSCLRDTWQLVKTNTVQSAAARYPTEIQFNNIPSPNVGKTLVAAYFRRGYERLGFAPPYPTWPIRPSAFQDAHEFSPRELIGIAEAHLRKCRQTGVITELEALTSAERAADPSELRHTDPRPDNELPPQAAQFFAVLDAEFAAERKAAQIDAALDEKHADDTLPTLLQAGLAAWIDENGLSDSFSIDGLPGRNPPLHARLRQTLNLDTEDEVHWSIRAVLNAHHTSALNRLRAAITASGLGLARGRRNLIILRSREWAKGAVTQQVLGEFGKLGGTTLKLQLNDLTVFAALNTLRQRHGDAVTPWLQSRQPASGTGLLTAMLSDYPTAAPASTPRAHTAEANGAGGEQESQYRSADGARPHSPDQSSRAPLSDPTISLGTSPDTNKPIDIKLEDLRRHMAVFAGSGSGKTVLIRRVIEECALAGVSSIVLDPNNDLARLCMAWPEPPRGWREGDEERAKRYFEQTEIVIWTPRRTTGRPLSFQPIGDLSAVMDDPDDFAIAVDNAVATLLPRAGLPRSGAKADQGQAVLRESLRQYAQDGGSGLKDFLTYLGALPDDVSSIANSSKIAHGMAQTLIAATVNDPLFGGEGEPVDPGELLTPSKGRTARISVISLIGLPNDDQRQSFVNQLQMALFAWAKKNPAGDRPLGGLYVMDEAQTFAPSSPATACTQSTLALAAQARKYGLGLIFATQAPKGLHNRIVGNATTQVYGFMNAPAQITAIREIAAMKGGDVPDISRLKPGLFYIASDDIALQKIATPNCLSFHPKSPLTPLDVLNLASAR